MQGVASSRLQRTADAVLFLTEAEDLARASHEELLAEVLLAMGLVRFLAGDTIAAGKAYGESLQAAQKYKDPFVEAAALGGLGLIATKQERYDESIDLDRAAERLAESVGAQNTLVAVLGNSGWCYRKLGDFENALTFYKEATDVSARNGHVGLKLYWLTGLSNVYLEQRDYGSAETVLTQALDPARSQGDKRTLLEYLNALAEIALETGRVETAEKYYAEAAAIEQADGDQSGVMDSLLVRGRIDQKKRIYKEAKTLFARVIGNSKADAAQKWEAQARLAEIYAEEGEFHEADSEFRQSLRTVESVRTSVQAENLRLSFLSSGIDLYDGYISFLISQNREEDALRVAESSRARTLEEGLATPGDKAKPSSLALQPQHLAKRLRATLFFYWIGHNQSHLWVITPLKVAYFTLPKAAEIEAVVKSYRRAVLGMRDAQDAGNADGKRLYAMLVEPAKKLIPEGSRVIVLPDESLYGLNFETLVVPDPQPHFWIEDVTLTTAGSLTLLERSAAGSATKEKNLLLIGNTEQPNADFPTLPQASAEMQKVEHYFPDPQRKVLEGGQATPSAYLNSNPDRFAYLHFVTHGTASHTRPLESAVILSKEGDSYKLYARDIVQHHLNANLVTISACNGSGTRAYSGEGLVGLSWAFLRAGAHNVIGALWEVSDASTPQLMDMLYAELSQGRDPAVALRDAKLSLLHSADARSVFRKPFYWAPFQLYAGS